MQRSISSSLVLGFATTGITTLALLFGTNSAQAAIVQFTDLASFQANTSGLTTIDFEGLAPRGSYENYSITGLTNSGVKFTGLSSYYGYLYVMDSAAAPIYYDWGGSGAVLLGDYNGTITATLPSGVTAIGSDIMSVISYASPFNITLSTGEKFNLNSLNYPDRQFVGFTSDTAIASISFQTMAGWAELDNFRFGTASTATSVPEPFTIIGTFIGGTAAFRMSKKLKSARK
ncbi:hypothetical protein [Chamaesiphon sp. VAR_48_metabat_135_sub]|uniref:hypothetical protein n=1 Tax=Chamaesiphon sp. VAR_48_metabat_135_sub TaxID=2964699 RepID=UPI00286AAC39|nr:hypothetical protein [Chamaesiphon sp. VAR_48_metabat_135_sub]